MKFMSKRRRCPICGSQVRRGARLCSACGHELRAEHASEHCPECGARIPTGAAVCPICRAARPQAAPARWHSLILPVLIVVLVGGCGGFAAWYKPWEQLSVRESVRRLGQTSLNALNPSHLGLAATATPTATPYATRRGAPTLTPPPTATVAAMLAPTLVPTLTPQPTEPPALAPLLEPTLEPTTVVSSHTVASGDTPIAIATRYGMALEDFLRLNGFTERVILQVGQEVAVSPSAAAPQALAAAAPLPAGAASMALSPATAMPLAVGGPAIRATMAETPPPEPTAVAGASATPGQLVHVVASGDILGALAAKYDVSSDAIARANGISISTVLRVGQQLIIPGIELPSTATPTPAPTSTPSVTPTAKPTLLPKSEAAKYEYLRPLLLAPVDGGTIAGTEQHGVLNWTSVGILAEREWYEVSLWSPKAQEPTLFYTKATSQRLDPGPRLAEDALAEDYAWQVRVVYRDTATGSVVALSPTSQRYGFRW